jgi:Phosphotransferase enzyme family
MEHQRLAARYLGQFNGAYLAGQPLPKLEAWMLPGRTHGWVEMLQADADRLRKFSKTELGRWLSDDSIDRMVKLSTNRRQLLAKLDQLPACFCHHDAFRRNLMFRTAPNGTTELVAID